MKSLEQTNALLVNNIDTCINDMKSATYYIASNYNTGLLRLKEYNGTNDFFLSQTNFLNMITTISKTREYDSIYLFVPENGLAISQNTFDSITSATEEEIRGLNSYHYIKQAINNFDVLPYVERVVEYPSNLFGVYYRMDSDNYILVTMSKKYFDKMISNEYKAHFDYIIISDSNGNPVYSNDGEFSKMALENNSDLRSESKNEVRVNDKEYIVSRAHSGASGWVISTYTGLGVLKKTTAKINTVVLTLGLFFVLMLLAVSYVLSLKLSKNARKLSIAMRDAAYNEPKQIEVIKSNDEFEQLSIVYNDMIKELLNNKIHAKDMEIRSLQQQINPHFLYNTFDVISYFILNNQNEIANQMIERLCDIFRYNIVYDNNYHTIVQNELENLKNYLYIHEIKNGGELKIKWQIDPEILPFKMLKFILQPITENAFSHGFKNVSRNKIVIIKGYIRNEDIVFEVSDNGEGLTFERLIYVRSVLAGKEQIISKAPIGIGLTNINARLKLEYGENYGILIDSRIDKGTTVTVVIPKKSQ